ncbi:hypothetical protein [Peribacillus kribbensis]|uniref:hypothetical protein n=1 Tax=Peribacillus kribbensis TaxID=356658 RepID=UPI00041E2866|nr:hypothetical protein [Peribacillus kribbensis]
MKKWLAIPIVLIFLYLVCHTTPELSLRSHVGYMGYFKSAFTSSIVEDEYHNKMDKKKLQKDNAKCYTLTKPPIEEATQGVLRNFKVKKVGFLYYTDYYGEL